MTSGPPACRIGACPRQDHRRTVGTMHLAPLSDPTKSALILALAMLPIIIFALVTVLLGY